MAKKVDPFAKSIHDLCVAARAKCGAKCDPAARKAANASVKRVAQISGLRRRALTVSEAERMCRDRR